MYKYNFTKIVLISAATVMFLLFSYYFATTIINNLWDDTTFRLVQVALFVGAGVFLALSKIINNQEKIIQLLQERNKNDNA